MRNLRHLLRRSGLLSAQKRPRRASQSRAGLKRQLSNEALEKRELLAGDILFAHNYLNPADVNDNLQITASDALRVINQLDATNGESIQVTQAGQLGNYSDVNGDGWVTTADALAVINAVSRGEAASAGVEMFLNIRDENDAALTTTTERTATIDVGDVFYLELSYSDLRTFGGDIGAFQIVTDIVADQAGVLTPIVTDTDELNIESTIFDADQDTGTATFKLSDDPNDEVVVGLGTLADDLTGQIKAAVVQLGGYDAADIIVTPLFEDALGRFPGQDPLQEGEQGNLAFRIRYNDFALANQDLPDLQVTFNTDVTVRTEVTSTSPLDENGNIRASAVGKNIDTRSRTAPGAGTFGRDIYNLLTSGNYIEDNGDGTTLFDEFRVVGPAAGGGIEQVVPGFEEPFDTFSIPLRVTSPVSNLNFNLSLASDPEKVLLYGEPGKDANGVDNAIVTDEQIVLDPVQTKVTLNVVGTSANVAPVITIAGTDSATQSLDETNAALSATGTLTVTDTDSADTVSASVVSVVASGDVGTLTNADVLPFLTLGANPVIDGVNTTGTISYTFNSGTQAFEYLNDDQSLVLTYTVRATDSASPSASDDQTVVVTINGVTDVGDQAPDAGDGVLMTAEDNAGTLDLGPLLTGGAPTSVVVSTANASTNGTASIVNNQLTYTPNADFFGMDTVIYTASNSVDADDGTIMVTVTAVNDLPTADDDTANTTINTPVTINVLEGDSTGPANENDTPTVTVGTNSAQGGTLSVTNNNVVYTPATDFTGTDTFTYTLSDGSDNVTATVTVNVSSTLAAPILEDAALPVTQNQAATLNLAPFISGGAFTPPLTVTGATLGNATINGTTLTYTPNANATGIDTLTYTATNSTDTVSASITVTISATAPENQPPTSGPVTVTATEDTNATFTSVVLLANASPGTGETGTQTVSITGVGSSSTSGGGTVTLNGAGGIDYAPAANFFGSDTFTVQITDTGTPAASATFTVTVNVAGVNDAPVSVGDAAVTVTSGTTARIQVLANDNAGPANENQALTIVNPTSAGGAVTANSDGTISFTPNAGFTGNTTVNYTIRDSDGATANGSVNVTVRDFTPTTVTGAIFRDEIENIDAVIRSGATPFRDGNRDAGEIGIGGILVRLVGSEGATVTAVRTDANGEYVIENVAPGSYTIVYDVPNTVMLAPGSSTSAALEIGPEGSTGPVGPSLAVLGTQGSAIETVDILASSYLRTNGSVASMSNNGREGALVSMDAAGNQEFFIAGEGFSDVAHSELLLNEDKSAALLVVVRNGQTSVARVDGANFVVSADGRGVQFFGGVDDYEFTDPDNLISQEFANYQDAIDRAIADL